MNDPIFDGEPHILSDEQGYIAHRIDAYCSIRDINNHVKKLANSYATYIYENDRKRAIECLSEMLEIQMCTCNTDSNYSLTLKPAHMVSWLAEFAIIFIKFERLDNDNLEKK